MFLFNGQNVSLIDSNGSMVNVGDIMEYELTDIFDVDHTFTCRVMEIVKDSHEENRINVRCADLNGNEEDYTEDAPILVESKLILIGENAYRSYLRKATKLIDLDSEEADILLT